MHGVPDSIIVGKLSNTFKQYRDAIGAWIRDKAGKIEITITFYGYLSCTF